MLICSYTMGGPFILLQPCPNFVSLNAANMKYDFQRKINLEAQKKNTHARLEKKG